MKKIFLICLIVVSISTALFSQKNFPQFTVEAYGESARLKEANSLVAVTEDTLEHNFVLVITMPPISTTTVTVTTPNPAAAIPGSNSAEYQPTQEVRVVKSDPLENIVAIHVKIGDLFSGKFLLNDVGNIPDKSYYGVKENKHYIKVYLGDITKSSVKNYSVQLENTEGALSPAATGVLNK
jgi:hypothetical protein